LQNPTVNLALPRIWFAKKSFCIWAEQGSFSSQISFLAWSVNKENGVLERPNTNISSGMSYFFYILHLMVFAEA